MSIFLPAVWWIVALHWAEDRGVAPPFHRRRWVRAPLVFASAMWLAMLTNPWHGQFLVPVVGQRNLYGPLWWLMAIPNYALILGAGVVVLRALRRMDARPTRSQAAFLIVASGITLVANWAYVSGAGPPAGVTLPLISVAVLILVVGMLRQGLFGVLPVALRVIASHDPDGLLVVRGERLVHANPRARELLSPVDLAAGVPMPDALGPRLHRDGTRAVREWDAWWQAVLAPGGALLPLRRRHAALAARERAAGVRRDAGACWPTACASTTRPRSSAPRSSCGARDAWRAWPSSPGVWPTTSTTCSPW